MHFWSPKYGLCCMRGLVVFTHPAASVCPTRRASPRAPRSCRAGPPAPRGGSAPANRRAGTPGSGYILTTDQSDAGHVGIFSRRTNRPQAAGYILKTDQTPRSTRVAAIRRGTRVEPYSGAISASVHNWGEN
eukprot:3327939-Pyramimonas_sp.AAC.1